MRTLFDSYDSIDDAASPLAASTVFELNDGVAGPIEIHTYDLGGRGFRVVGLVRRAPAR